MPTEWLAKGSTTMLEYMYLMLAPTMPNMFLLIMKICYGYLKVFFLSTYL